ncbi:MAG: hypothetical protein F4121_01615 [Acidimicrobiia bacterium]|nr:hypothetical protein [Acidimicrobiia bacterium]MYC45948.1 hypothetical protein [Acidimicrobiia bacterium]MYI18812.1 hypothetical protein [Acidimicrobiia bacterium]
MNGNRDTGQPAEHDRTLGADLGAAIGRRSESLDRIPPVAGVVERAATAASARRLRYTLVGVAAAAALLAGSLVAWNTLGNDGGSVRVATAPATSAAAPATPESGNSRAADPQPSAVPPEDPAPVESTPADPQPAAPERSDDAASDAGLVDPEPASRTTEGPAEQAHDPETEPAGCETLALTDTKCKCPCPEAPFEHFFKGRIAKDGYELRFDEPPGGMTLWDLVADAPVYELEPEAFEGGPVPDGVHLTQNDDGSVTVVFEHPGTGEELVTVITKRTSSTGLTFENPFEDLPDLSFEGLPDLSIEDLHEYLDKWLEDLDDQLEEFNDRFEDLIPYVDWSAPGLDPADLLERLRERLDGSRHDRPTEPTTLGVRVSRA